MGVVVKRGDTPKAAYALEQGVKLLHYYNDYFGVRFPLPKLDLIAAPGEINGGSMENWGAIFYSQHHVLFDPAKSIEADRRVVFLVVAHEMAHQWFGDLVTMSWWDNLWLNEGFARWMQTFVADDLHPEWETGLQASSIFERGKQADAVPSTHPVVQEVLTADQAEEAFDFITYDKGANIITMMNAYVGRDQFRDGVRRYMHAHAFGNTVDSDLWSLMQQAVGKPILAIERDFTRQSGVPLVRVTRTAQGVQLKVVALRRIPPPSGMRRTRCGACLWWSSQPTATVRLSCCAAQRISRSSCRCSSMRASWLTPGCSMTTTASGHCSPGWENSSRSTSWVC